MDEAEKKYQEFKEKVKRTVFIDSLTPQATVPIVKTALNQFGSVKSVQFLRNYENLKHTPLCALVEMENPKQAGAVVAEMTNYPFMISGMPRPVRGFPAQIEMFADRPVKPGRKISCRWMDPKDEDFQVAKKIKLLTRKHRAEAEWLLQLQLEEAEKLHKQQAETLKANHKKFDLIDKLRTEGVIQRLSRRYELKLRDDY